jgi:two-component system chemotaxis response regulator CheY
MGQARLNLKGVTALLLDSDQFSRGLISSMLRGFGMDPPVIGQTGADAMSYLNGNAVDLCIMEAMLPDMSGAELIRWLRRPEMEKIRFVPVVVLTSYAQLRQVSAARDGGANIIVRKPVSPQSLFDRITWVARVARPFIDAPNYSGPDRRFQSIDPPDGAFKRGDDANRGKEAAPKVVNKLVEAVAKGGAQ